MEKKWSSRYFLTLHLCFAVAVFLGLILYKNGLNVSGGLTVLDNLPLFTLLILIGLIPERNYHLSLKNHILTIGSQTFIPRPQTISIFDITRIERKPSKIFKTWGSDLVFIIGHQSEEGELSVMESNFTISDIKDFLQTLKSLYPSLGLTQQYQDLLAGKYTDGHFRELIAED